VHAVESAGGVGFERGEQGVKALGRRPRGCDEFERLALGGLRAAAADQGQGLGDLVPAVVRFRATLNCRAAQCLSLLGESWIPKLQQSSGSARLTCAGPI
jgi:hypothetical protein